MGNPLKYADPTGHYTCSYWQDPDQPIATADCYTWAERVLKDLASSGPTGYDLVEFFRNLDKQLGGKFSFLFTDAFGAGMAPPGIDSVLLPTNMYETASATWDWFDNLGLIAHELAHLKTSNDWERITTRSEAAAYQTQGIIETNLAAQGRGPAPSGPAAEALNVDLNNWGQLEQFQEYLVGYYAFPNNVLYAREPIWGYARDRYERLARSGRLVVPGISPGFLPGHEFQ